jgi:hypothetical protein
MMVFVNSRFRPIRALHGLLASRWGPRILVALEAAALFLALPRLVHGSVALFLVLFWGISTVCYLGNYRLWRRLQRTSVR